MMDQQLELFPTSFEKTAYQYGQRSDGEIHGVVLTKPHIVDLILDLAIYKHDNDLTSKRLLEPSCGHGAFLIPAVNRLFESFKFTDATFNQLKQTITAFDIDSSHVAQTKQVLENLIITKGFTSKDARQLTSAWIHEGDFLLADPNEKFDYIIGNPPYIRIEQISPVLQKEYRRRYSSLFDRADLYVAFIERSLDLLNDHGVLSFICADRWILNKYGAPLRSKITAKFSVKSYIDLHSASPFDSDVVAYPSIFVLQRKRNISTQVMQLKSADKENCNAIIKAREGDFFFQQQVEFAEYDSWFEGASPWTLSSPQHLKTLRELESKFRPLEEDGTTKIKIGVASGCDQIYIIDKPHGIESSRLLPLVMRSNIVKGKIKNVSKFIINTFEDNGPAIDLKKYPGLKTYFEKHSSDIRNRHVAKKNPSAWFRTIDRVYPEFVSRPKLLIPDIAGSNEVTFDRGEYYPHHNLYFLISDDWDLEVLGGLLSSKIALFFVWSYATKMRGNYLRFQAQYLRRIRVPSPDDLTSELKKDIKAAFRKRDFSQLDLLAMKAYQLKDMPHFDFVETRK